MWYRCDICMKEYYDFECPRHFRRKMEVNAPITITKMFLRDYGNVNVKRIGELRRRVILPDKPTDGSDYFVGRRGENGKIQDREPSY